MSRATSIVTGDRLATARHRGGTMSSMQAEPAECDRTIAGPTLLHGAFEAQAIRRPDHPAIECRGITLTYGELDRLANRYAHYFRSQGLGPGRLVALHLEKSVELFAALLGVLKAGAGYVPIDPKFPPERVRSIIDDGPIPLVVSQTSLATALGDTGARALLIDRDLDQVAAMPDAPIPADEN